MKQDELFNAETTWFHVFRSMVENGDVAKMGAEATTLYLVIKAHTNFSTGRSFPSLDTIAEKSGISKATIKRKMKILEEFGYITKEKKGRSNIYTLREKVEIVDGDGRPSAVATWDYLPTTVSHAVADLKNVLVTGDLGKAQIVHIERLSLNVQIGDHNTQMNFQDAAKAVNDIKDPKLREVLARRLVEAAEKAGYGGVDN